MKKGFTLIELLGVIVIIGIIALITVPAVDSIVKKGKQRAYDMTKDTIITATKNWLTDNKSLFADGDTLTLTLSDLKEQGYLDFDIKNPSSGACLDNRMQVSVARSGKKYNYAIVGDELVDGIEADCTAVGKVPSIYLLGSNPLDIEINSTFSDPGAKATATGGNDISNKIVTSGTIDTSVLADNIKYKYTVLSDGITKTITRRINVVDTVAPLISGIDDITIYTSNTTFNIMDGVSVTDDSGETITIKTKSNLSLGVKGVYTVTYIATDSSGNTTIVTRNITVQKGISILKTYSSGNYFWNTAYNTKIESIEFVEYVNTTNSVVSWDLSSTDDGSITGWLMTDTGNPSYYKMYIGSENSIYANPNSSSLFAGLTSLFSIAFDNFNTSNVTNMSNMFYNASSLTSLNLSSLNTSNVTNMTYMFRDTKSLISLDLSNFNTSNVTDMQCMFFNASSLTSLNLSSFNTSNVTNMAGMFGYMLSLQSLNLSDFDTSNVTDMSNMFAMGYETTKNSDIALKSLNLTSFNTSNVTNMNSMFRGFASLTSLNLSNFDTTKVTNMNSMFYNCNSIISLDLSSFNTPNLVSTNLMFNSMDKVQSINLSNFKTLNVTDMSGMFRRCHALTSLNLSSFDTSKVTNMSGMFLQSDALTNLDLSSFNTSNVVDMSYMFSYTYSLASLNLSSFNTIRVVNMSNMFIYASALTSLDLSSFNTTAVTNMNLMFRSSTKLATIYVGTNWTTASATTVDMFTRCGTSTVTLK